jgi:predicted aldo/keto reductase-like oxidoreductase
MNTNENDGVSRRTFIKAGMTTAAVVGMAIDAVAGEPEGEQDQPPGPLPQRVLGRTGGKVTILALGMARAPTPRMLNAGYDAGIRCIDTGASYANRASERGIGTWMAETGRRQEIYLITKDHPRAPNKWEPQVDRSLEALKTDYIDLFLIHSLGGGFSGPEVEEHRDIPRLKEWAAAADKIRRTGKARAVGISTHAEFPLRTTLLNNAAEGGWVDAVMVSYDPKLVRENAEFNKALDACHKAGVGLICMKEMRAVEAMPKILPEFEELGLTPHQAVLHAVWTDERIATVTSEMPNLPILQENSAAAQNFKPLKPTKIGAVIGLYERYGRRFCNACDGRCRRAGRTKAALNDITRALSYYECDGQHEEARKLYASLGPEQRDWHGADLAAASAACFAKLDFATLLPRAEQKLA